MGAMTLILGDCVTVMEGMEPASVDAVVTDPPYSISFMGRTWDKSFGHGAWAETALRVAKPGAYLLAFGGTRTYHRLACAIEDAGWIIRDCLVWAYASGFPKSRALLKPAWEPIVMARKPGPLRELAIDACRIPGQWSTWRRRDGSINPSAGFADEYVAGTERPEGVRNDESPTGRWPSNLILTDPIFDGDTPGVVGGGETASGSRQGEYGGSGSWSGQYGPVSRAIDGDSGTYSRFFLIPKADRADREPVLGGLEARPAGLANESGRRLPDRRARLPHDRAQRANHHPTVKPTELMRHLVRLVTPSGGTVLDPFLGSGTTAIAAEMEGFQWIGIEREEEYVRIAEARLQGVQRGMGLTA
jgi:site-specific DNA-methyltransferase (adenine-specific)